MNAGSSPNVIEAIHLSKQFKLKRRSVFDAVPPPVRAVDDVSFAIARGETLGLVGESGCGKTTVGRLLLALERPTGGSILFGGVDLTKLDAGAIRPLRRGMQMIFQDPYGALNPRMTVEQIIAEPLIIQGARFDQATRERTRELLDLVGLSSAHATRYPHEFSGGQRQRIGIARALALQPQLIVCDEPVSALDVSVQAQVVNLLQDLQERFSLSYLFIGHDLAVVRHISHRVAVMYLGRIVELSSKQQLYGDPLHPYTSALLDSVPSPRPSRESRRPILAGDPATSDRPLRGCLFQNRCPQVVEICRSTAPALEEKRSGHWVACHRIDAGEKAMDGFTEFPVSSNAQTAKAVPSIPVQSINSNPP